MTSLSAAVVGALGGSRVDKKQLIVMGWFALIAVLADLVGHSLAGGMAAHASSASFDVNQVSSTDLARIGGTIIFGASDPTGRVTGAGRGQCTLCHSFESTKNSHYFLGPNLSHVTDLAEQRLKDPRYHLGDPQRRDTVVQEAYPGSGTATNALEYLAESLLCASCYVVAGHGIPGTDDRQSREIEVTQPPISLRVAELIAIITWFYVHEGKVPPTPKSIEAALAKFVIPLEWARLTHDLDEPLPDPRAAVLVSGEERVDEIFAKAQCVACHVIPGVPGSTGTVGQSF